MIKKRLNPYLFIFLLIVLAYLLTHLLNLTALPVFADEAIYIRWAQLIIDDWQRYLFFPLNDGKTPIFIWLEIPFQFIFSNQLYAARIISVIVGLFQLWIMALLAKQYGGKRKAQLTAIFFTAFLPFWYFHQRAALMDALMTLFLSISLYIFLKTRRQKGRNQKIIMSLGSGLFFGLALLTKVPAILFVPVFILLGLIETRRYKGKNKKILAFLAFNFCFFLFGFLPFGLLAFSPSFPQLFSRGSDFLYPLSEVIHGRWWSNLLRLPEYSNYYFHYLTWPVMLSAISALFLFRDKRKIYLLWGVFILSIFPMIIMGQTVRPRYFMSSIIFPTLLASLAIEQFILLINKESSLLKKTLKSIVFVSFIAITIQSSALFILTSMFSPDQTPFLAVDKGQYLEDWSSGHGINEVVQFIKNESQTKRIAVATEGSFGTLPDGILLYFHRRNVDNIYIEGIGQPVKSIPESFSERAKDYDEVFLVVNSHRMELHLNDDQLVAQYDRPEDAPSLQLWKLDKDNL